MFFDFKTEYVNAVLTVEKSCGAGLGITGTIAIFTNNIMLDNRRIADTNERVANSTIATQQSTVENERVNTMAKYLKQRNEQDALRNEDKRLDQKAVAGGFMTSEDYAAKWNQWDKVSSSGSSSCDSSFPS